MRRALVVGIDGYPDPYRLNGCVADAHAWGDVLAARKFAVEMLTDASATQLGILGALLGMVQDARPGDVLAFVYSGHGTTLRDLDGDERDGRDEALCPVDFPNGRFIVDDDIRHILTQLPIGVGMTCVMDCCHSGSITRFAGGNVGGRGARSRYVRVTPAMEAEHTAARRGTRATAPVTPEDLRWVTLSACLPIEVAYESADESGQVGGDFTRHATAVLRESGRALTHAGFLKRVLERFGPARAQTPNVDAPAGGAKRTLVTVPKAA